MPLPQYIFISGRMAAGKDFLGQALIRKRGYLRVNFADAVYDDVAKLHGVQVAEIRANKDLYRGDLQQVGQAERDKDPSHWLRIWQSKVVDLPAHQPVVVTDVRYPNESALGVSLGDSLLVRMALEPAVRLQRVRALYPSTTPEMLTRPSETMVDFCPFHVAFSGVSLEHELIETLEELHRDWREMGKPVHTLVTRERRPRVYIAGPITIGDEDANVRAAMVAWHELYAAGIDAFCPHLSVRLQGLKSLEHKEWLTHDENWLSVCDALVRLPGLSVGADHEVKFAESLGLPVFQSTDDAIRFFDKSDQ